MWEDQSIETCDDWLIPYIGDLLATNLVANLDAPGQRLDVAKTIYYRRRKGLSWRSLRRSLPTLRAGNEGRRVLPPGPDEPATASTRRSGWPPRRTPTSPRSSRPRA